jgi:hypothetical protein
MTLTTQCIRRGAFTSVSELECAVYDYIEHNNSAPQPFIWTKSANEIILKVSRNRNALNMPSLAKGNE